jgi:transposase
LKTEFLHLLPEDIRVKTAEELGRLVLSHEKQAKLIRALQEEVRLLRIEKYGSKSEKLSDLQLQFLEEEPGVAKEEVQLEAQAEPLEPARRKPRKHPGRNGFPAGLPREEHIVPCAESECPFCRKTMSVFGYDVSEELHVIPAKYTVKVIKKEKRACPDCPEAGVKTAPSEAKPVDKCKVSTPVIVDVVISKYCNHLPLYRQCVILERDFGIELSRSTMCGWVMQVGTWLEAVSQAMRANLLAGSYIQADETTVGVQNETATGKNHTAYLWEYSRPGGPVVFNFRMGRGREGPKIFLGKYCGILQCDGFSAYDEIGGEGIRYAGCMAHVRRGFVEALKLEPTHAGAKAICADIRRLYAVESQARGVLSPGERQLLRAAKTKPMLEALKEKITALSKRELPQSHLGKACQYALNQWERVVLYASEGEIEIDNNWCENAMRPVALGRKNWIHIGSENAGPKVAAIISVIETCRRLGVNVRDYLTDILPRIPEWPMKAIAELTPMAWQKRQAEQAKTAAAV